MKKPFNLFTRIMEFCVIVTFLGLVAVVLLQVYARLFLPRSPHWTEEASRFLFAYTVSFAAGLAVKEKAYVNVDVFTNLLPEMLKQWLEVLLDLLVAAFMAVCFRGLQRDGQIERAGAVARGAVRQAPDWWMPVLFMRLRSGRLWYTPGVGEDGHGLEKWPALLRNIRLGRCTPILGPGLSEPLLGSRRQMAPRWAEASSYPLPAHARDNLPPVAQHLPVNQDPVFARDELAESIRGAILATSRPNIPPALPQAERPRPAKAPAAPGTPSARPTCTTRPRCNWWAICTIYWATICGCPPGRCR